MDNTVCILGSEFEYDFLSCWIKYNRMESCISQEALAHGICSVSHLSYFENCKKRLRREIIEALLKRLKIATIPDVKYIGLIRQKLHKLAFYIESFEYDAAELAFAELLTLEPILQNSAYNIEFNIYKLMYNILVDRKAYTELETSINKLDKIYYNLDIGLQYLFLLSTGKFLYDNLNHTEGINRLEKAYRMKDTPWINYRLGVAYLHSLEPLKAVIYLEKALNSYAMTGRYRNSLECHNFLGSCYESLKIYAKADYHFKTVLSGSEFFSLNKNIFGIYTSLASLYLNMNRYEESITFCKLAMNAPVLSTNTDPWQKSAWHANEEPMIAACIYIEVLIKLKEFLNSKEIFDRYLTSTYKNSLYYHYLHTLYLSIFQFDEDIFYVQVTKITLPFYKKIGFLNIYNKVQLLLIRYLESNRRYKEANSIYKSLFG
ncbi:transcriptional regulator [Clostridium sp. YIM B02515]|uniref:Transcriptional regulator n=1 Tax=Clostridium rhizosphaerae TaxID=2803861 RepID=A0ABS1T6R0_9CLOT|nr:transcriptional regulator [Clostridium rhizosphaerae]MBL4935025.1 transcriptional regulator [Clostridium rhizosphaerae]